MMINCLLQKIKEQIVKMSASLERDAVYTKTSLIDRLPAYLTVQFVRFYYKEREAVNAKILKDVKFPLQFDARELCSPRLQDLIEPARARFKAVEDKKTADALEGKEKPKPPKGHEPMEVFKRIHLVFVSFERKIELLKVTIWKMVQDEVFLTTNSCSEVMKTCKTIPNSASICQ